jgi:hypothetical protein
MREKITAYIILVRKPEGKRPLGRPKRGGENIIKKEIKCHGKVRDKLVWLRTVTSGWLFLARHMHIRIQYKAQNTSSVSVLKN